MKIKFRVWDKRKSKWISRSGAGSHALVDMEGSLAMSTPSGVKYVEGFDQYETCLFIDILDGNDKEIYEGDIITGHARYWEDFIGIVVWSDDYASFAIETRMRGDIDLLDFGVAMQNLKVVGNCFEHPELVAKCDAGELP